MIEYLVPPLVLALIYIWSSAIVWARAQVALLLPISFKATAPLAETTQYLTVSCPGNLVGTG